MKVDEYLLGHDAEELQRLEEQARLLAPATEAILTMAGVAPGMRVLDLGTGAGDVAMALADRVGPTGAVVGIDQSDDALATAERRARERGQTNVTFVRGDVVTADVDGGFDAVVGRLVLLYTPDPAAVLERCAALLTSGGVVVSMEYEMRAAGLLPSGPLSRRVVDWVCEAFVRSGLDPSLGARMAAHFRTAGLEPESVGLQGYYPPGTPEGPRMGVGIVRTLIPVIERCAVATAAEIEIDTLERRLGEEQVAIDAMFKPPTLVGTWARVA